MMHVVRTAAPGDLLKPIRSIAEEKLLVKAFYDGKSKEKPKFKAYNTKQVKDALNTLFNGKCAYCESPMIAVTAGDIEHFRPKAKIANKGEKSTSYGYYWLAYEWENLLIACDSCNRTGKRNQFPVDPPGSYALDDKTGINKEEEKRRLLLNPCIDYPEEHLQFMEDGALIPIVKKNTSSAMGNASIDVYRLNRVPLVGRRAARLQEIKFNISVIIAAKEALGRARQKGDKQEEKIQFENMDRAVENLKKYRDVKSDYSGMANQLIPMILKENNLA